MTLPPVGLIVTWIGVAVACLILWGVGSYIIATYFLQDEESIPVVGFMLAFVILLVLGAIFAL